MAKRDDEFEGRDTVTLTLDDDSELECIVLNIFKGGDREYIALLPTEGIEAEEGTVYLYRYEEDEQGNPNLTIAVNFDKIKTLGRYSKLTNLLKVFYISFSSSKNLLGNFSFPEASPTQYK